MKKGKGEVRVEKPKPRKQLIVPGKMVMGGKAAEGVEQSEAIEKRKKEAKLKKKKAEENSWIHSSEQTINTYKPSVLPFFSNYTAEKKVKG